jgi:hypothetical protein
LYLRNQEFKDYYTKEVFRFIDNNLIDTSGKNLDYFTHMTFAEQRLIAMCARKKGKQVKHLLEQNHDEWCNQDLVTHVWGYKHNIRHDENKKFEFCIRCILRIIKDFPEWSHLLCSIQQFHKYIYAIEELKIVV